jgi:hypothetical protein
MVLGTAKLTEESLWEATFQRRSARLRPLTEAGGVAPVDVMIAGQTDRHGCQHCLRRPDLHSVQCPWMATTTPRLAV